ncbi:MAG: hypothetical protein JW955_24780 [Sedimentisphaerales bacterium]|nr:hypothetical protein [Sedimentisphaerales bacterium]
MDAMPIWAVLAGAIVVVLLAYEVGYRLGRTVGRRADPEKEPPASAIAASILGLTAFILAFTFGIATDRYDERKAFVRDEANAINTAYLRSDFLPVPDRGKAQELLRRYVDSRLASVQSGDLEQLHRALQESDQIQRQLWETAVVNARQDMNSDVAALYVDSLNEVIELHAVRVAVGLYARIPSGIWLVLGILILLGLIGVGYQSAIGDSRRSRAILVLALAFGVVITLIASLDRSQSGLTPVSQRPLEALRSSMAKDVHATGDRGESAGPSSAGRRLDMPLPAEQENVE